MQEHLNHPQIGKIRSLAKAQGIPYHFADRRKLDQLANGVNHQGVIALAAAQQYVEVADILARAQANGEPPFVVICEGLTDAQNLGSILRTANAAGVHGVIIPKNRSVALNAVVAKVSAGAIEYTPVAKVANITQTLEKLKKEGLWIVGTDVSGTQRHFDCDLRGPVGNCHRQRGRGDEQVSARALRLCGHDSYARRIESLNASWQRVF